MTWEWHICDSDNNLFNLLPDIWLCATLRLQRQSTCLLIKVHKKKFVTKDEDVKSLLPLSLLVEAPVARFQNPTSLRCWIIAFTNSGAHTTNSADDNLFNYIQQRFPSFLSRLILDKLKVVFPPSRTGCFATHREFALKKTTTTIILYNYKLQLFISIIFLRYLSFHYEQNTPVGTWSSELLAPPNPPYWPPSIHHISLESPS